MVEVKFYGIARITLGCAGVQTEASTIKELQEKLAVQFALPVKKISDFLVYVNDTQAKNSRAKLHDGDKVMFLSPSSGG